MLLSFHDKETKKVIMTGTVRDFVWRAESKSRVALSPGEYWVDIYAEPAEDDFFIEQWEPIEQSNLLVLETAHKPQLVWKLPVTLSQHRLIRRIRFQITNDSLFPKVLRWRFEAKEKSASRSWQIPMYIRVSRLKSFQIVASLSLVQLLNQIYEMGITLTSRRTPTIPWVDWIVATLITTLLFTALVWVSLRFLLGTFWNEKE